jgi:O-acetyl-ADP-ribose deacetylase (regulator of RNase III)
MKISLLKADITEIEIDAIVNAANSSLMGGGGVDGAIHRKGGPQILEDCKEIRRTCGECPPGQAVITRAGELPAKYVIHTVGPIWRGGENEEAETLADCYRNSIQLALDNKLYRIAFPNISTGVYRFPKDKAAEIAIHTVQEFEDHQDLEEVVFVCFDEENYGLYKELL